MGRQEAKPVDVSIEADGNTWVRYASGTSVVISDAGDGNDIRTIQPQKPGLHLDAKVKKLVEAGAQDHRAI